jgi:hypothetical protein
MTLKKKSCSDATDSLLQQETCRPCSRVFRTLNLLTGSSYLARDRADQDTGTRSCFASIPPNDHPCSVYALPLNFCCVGLVGLRWTTESTWTHWKVRTVVLTRWLPQHSTDLMRIKPANGQFSQTIADCKVLFREIIARVE